MSIFWFIGWESNRYDENDKEIGNRVVFTTPMLLILDLPDDYAGEFIAENYGTFLTTKASWQNFEAWFPQIHVEEVSCKEVFVIENALYREKHGFLESAFSSDIKFYVLSSKNIKSTIIRHGNYEYYSSTDISMPYSCENNT